MTIKDILRVVGISKQMKIVYRDKTPVYPISGDEIIFAIPYVGGDDEEMIITVQKNTKLNYVYKDADNYKKFTECIVHGSFSDNMINKILDKCDDGKNFIPEQLGLPCNRFEDITDADHSFVELLSIEETTDTPTLDITAQELYNRFMDVEFWDMSFYGRKGE